MARPSVSVLVTDFDNRTSDPDFDGAVEQTLTTALETASFVTVYPRRSAGQVAAKLKPGTTRIDESMGRLISKSEGIGVIVTGAIEAAGERLRGHLRALDPSDEKKVVAEARATATDKGRVLPIVVSLADGIRRELGDTTSVAAGETFTAASLDAMRAFARAQELQRANRFDEALAEYQRAVDLDPGFARAYSGMAGVYINYFRQPEKAAASYEAAMKHLDRMTDREKYRTLGTYYLDIARNYEKAIENFETLVRLYPADDSGHGNLALAYLLIGDVQGALAGVRKSLEIYPKNSLQRYNYAMYSMYAGDYATAISEARRVHEESPQLEHAYLPAALSRLAQGDAAGAAESYRQLAAMSPLGASFARMGEADMAMYFGQYRAAVAPLAAAIATDVKENEHDAGRAEVRGARRGVSGAWPAAARRRRSPGRGTPQPAREHAVSGRQGSGCRRTRRSGAQARRRSRKGPPASHDRLRRHHPRRDRLAPGTPGGRDRDAARGRATPRFLVRQVRARESVPRSRPFCRGAHRAGAVPQAPRRNDRRLLLRLSRPSATSRRCTTGWAGRRKRSAPRPRRARVTNSSSPCGALPILPIRSPQDARKRLK